jgi:hypothetical protein
MNDNINNIYIYDEGDHIYNIYIKKQGIIKSLRNNSYEKSKREKDPTHYYYHIDYDDGSFNTYVNINDFIQINNIKINDLDNNITYSNYLPGHRFICKSNNKNGTIRYLRNDSYEISSRKSNSNHYYYSVDFDDGTFETYIHGINLLLV